MFYQLNPEVAGHLGPDTVIDRSTHPPIVHVLHYVLDGWPGDDLLTSFPCFIVTERMRKLIENTKASGCTFGPVRISTSEQFAELEQFHPKEQLPEFSWLIIRGVAGRDDFGTTTTGGSIIASERVP